MLLVAAGEGSSSRGKAAVGSAFGMKSKRVLSFIETVVSGVLSFSFLFYFSSYVFLPVLPLTALVGGFLQEVPLCITQGLSGRLCSAST